jgi:hypothetical protein
MKTIKETLKARFKASYPAGARLLAVQLDGFSHAVIFDGGKASSPVQREIFSGCMPEGKFPSRAAAVLGPVGHSAYQGNPKEIIYTLPGDR